MKPLSPHVEALLRAMPRAEAPEDLGSRVLAALAAREPRPTGDARPSWTTRWTVAIASAAAAAGVVLVGGALLEQGGAAPTAEWEQVHPMPASVAKVRVVDDPSLALFGVGAPVVAAVDPIDGP